MTILFDKITIIGFGLIGSSFARAVAQYGLAGEIICGDASAEVCKEVLALGLAATATSDLAASVQTADLVMLCAPVGAYAGIGKLIAPHLKAGAIVSDVGSVKMHVVKSLAGVLPDNVHFVPGHPIAGGEKSGPSAGSAAIFQNRWCIITPQDGTDEQAIAKVAELWTACGMTVERMDASHHDRVLAMTSHLPHLIAYTVVHTATELQDDMQEEVIKYSAGGFRDSTRMAASDPIMWRDVFLNNQEAVLEMLQRFTEDLTELQKAIRRGDGAALQEAFTRTRDIRRSIIEARQAYDQIDSTSGSSSSSK